MNNPPQLPGHLLGLAFDNEDGHQRITTAETFSILGGSQETHERMAEAVLKTLEMLSKKGKNLEDAQPQELRHLLKSNL